MGLFSFVGDLFGGGTQTTVTTQQKQDLIVNPVTNVDVNVDVDNTEIGQGIQAIGEGITGLGQSIGQGIAAQQDIINISIDTIDEKFNTQIIDNAKIALLVAGVFVIYFITSKSKSKKGGLNLGSLQLQLPKN